MASSRRKAREVALQALYEIDLGHGRPSEVIEGLAEEISLGPDLATYCLRLVQGIRANMSVLDERLNSCLKDYDIKRTLPVDRNVLRIAAYELLFIEDMPPAVTINEAIEIVRKYSTAESSKFINGVLGALVKETPKANWVPPVAEGRPVEVEEPFGEEEPIEVEEIDIEAGSPEEANIRRLGSWTIRSEF